MPLIQEPRYVVRSTTVPEGLYYLEDTHTGHQALAHRYPSRFAAHMAAARLCSKVCNDFSPTIAAADQYSTEENTRFIQYAHELFDHLLMARLARARATTLRETR